MKLDSVNVVSPIDGSLSSKKEIDWLEYEIKGLMVNRAYMILKHAPRSCNVVARNLPKADFSFSRRVNLN